MDALLARVIDEADAGQLPVLIDDWLAAGDARHWIARALRVDLAVLVERPDLVVPCLLRRCAWLGAEYPQIARRGEPPIEAAAVRGLARSWEAGWSKPYLRSMHTPLVPLDAGVIEEYRSGAPGPLWLTESHVGLGDDIAWDRSSGRRVRMAMPEPREATWRLVRERRELSSGSHVWPLPIDPAHEPLQLFELGEELALVTARYDEGYGEDYEYFTYVIDLQHGRQLDVFEGNSDAVARKGDRIYMTDRDRFYTWSWSAHRDLTGSVAGAGLVMAADGTFATRTEQVVRVFSPEHIVEARYSSDYRIGLASISPDGTRLISGRVMFDARTGEQLAAISFSGLGSWLEGGPPRNCRALCDDVVAEILPFGFHLWDSTTGETLVDNRDHRADHRDAVAFAPNGRTHAIVKRGTLTVYDNHSLRVVHEAVLAMEHTWRLALRFSHDGSALWWGDGDAPLQLLQLRTGRSEVPVTRAADIVDGVVTVGDLALPIDDAHAELSTDGSVIAGAVSHYVRS